MEKDKNFILINEPLTVDDTYAKRGENPLDWLKRSTVQRAKNARYFINHNLGKIPKQIREKLINSLSQNWSSALFELIVARYLQELGADFEYEKEIAGGKRPDFTVIFQDVPLIVEAINPIINKTIGKEFKLRNPLLDYIESRKPPNWSLSVLKLPKIGASDSKKEFRNEIDSIIREVKSTTKKNRLEISRTISTGDINLIFKRSNKSSKRIGIEPAIAFFDNTEKRIRYAFDEKREQVRNSPYPVILAINAGGIASEFNDFDKAIYGHSCEEWDDEITNIRNSYFKENGLFTKNKNSNPTYNGVLAFVRCGLLCKEPPVIYHHPYSKHKLPSSLLKIEQRYYDKENKQICTKKAKDLSFIDNLNFSEIK
jgi:hypothetical protein